jgi:hypothetical protein
MKHIFPLVLTLFIFLASPSVKAAQKPVGVPTISATSHAILEIVKNLGTEGESKNISQALQKFSHPQLVTALREGLRTGGDWSTIAARAANLLSVKDVLPDLEAAFEKNSDDWQVVVAIGALANDQQKKSMGETWAKQLRTFSNPTKVAVIEMLGRWSQPLPEAIFDSGIADKSLEVRRTVVTNFIITRNLFTTDQQIARFRKAFAMDPYQVRLDAMVAFQSLSIHDRAKLANAVDAKFLAQCKAETFEDVKTECQKILESRSAKNLKEAK